MNSPKTRQTLQPLEVEMSSVEAFSAVTRRAVEREQAREGSTFEQALSRVARRIRTGPGTLGNIIRERVKSVSFDLGARIIQDSIHGLEADLRRLEHERQALLQSGAGTNDRTLGRVVRALETVHSALNDIGATP
jgi:hypothetical protein